MVGKRVARRTYAHVSLIDELAEDDRRRVEEAVQISGLQAGEHFQVARLDPEHDEVALLSYPSFLDELFPSLLASWRVHLPTKAVRFRDYSSSLNPPILHRKELMLPASHTDQERLQRVTRLAESIGLFDDPVRIGFRNQWNELVASKGYMVVGQDLVPASNVEGPGADDTSPGLPTGTAVHRHLTALSRAFLSAPVQALLRHDLITESRSFFDYGCGKGDDLEGVRSLGISAAGWDPHFRADGSKQPADVVNIGFVINVIEDMRERIEALQGAYALTQGVLSVSAMLWSSASAKGRPFGDGYLTSRNTFQKYFSQGELQNFIESVLDEQAIPVGPGVFFVFKDRYLEQQFLSSRQSDPSRAPRLLAARQLLPRALRASRPARPRPDEDPARRAGAEAIWSHALTLGRLPEQDEYPQAEDAVTLFGSWSRAIRAATRETDHHLLEQAASRSLGRDPRLLRHAGLQSPQAAPRSRTPPATRHQDLLRLAGGRRSRGPSLAASMRGRRGNQGGLSTRRLPGTRLARHRPLAAAAHLAGVPTRAHPARLRGLRHRTLRRRPERGPRQDPHPVRQAHAHEV